MAHLLELKNVSKRYGENLALKGVSLGINEGERLAVVGPNGAGKTTLLRIAAGLDCPTEGEVHYRGARAEPGELRRVATMVFQKPVILSTTVYENVAYGLKIRGHPRGEVDRRVREALDMVKMSGYESVQARKLSGGQQQRVALARALALDAELLLLDEPTSNLDAESAAIIEKLLSWFAREGGRTVVVALHEIAEAEALAERVAFLMNGEITSVEPVHAALRRPQPFLSKFAKLENVFVGEASVDGGGLSSIKLDGGLAIKAVGKRTGRVTVAVRPEDIIISKQPISSSARNMFEGEVSEILDSGDVVKIKVSVDGTSFVAQITKKSFIDMGVAVGAKVFLIFKASSVYYL